MANGEGQGYPWTRVRYRTMSPMRAWGGHVMWSSAGFGLPFGASRTRAWALCLGTCRLKSRVLSLPYAFRLDAKKSC